MKIIVFNGPPRCGKDHACNIIARDPEFIHLKLSTPLKQTVASALNLSQKELEERKDDVLYGFNTHGKRTYRELQIDFFRYLASVYGEDVLGQMFLHRLAYGAYSLKAVQPQAIVISDGGRYKEMQPLVHRFGPENIMIIQVTRDGTSFHGDIRSYYEIEGATMVQIHNDGTETYIEKVRKAVYSFMDKS